MATTSASGSGVPHSSFREEVEKAFTQVSHLVKASMGPINAKLPYVPGNDSPQPEGGLLADLRSIGFPDVETLLQSFYDQTQGVQNDNTLLLERLVQLLSKLPADSKNAKSLTDGFVNQLWGALPHPPVTSLGSQYKYREPDGSNNSIAYPDLGKANMPYARSAKPVALQNIALPDPGAIFDSLLARGSKFEPHPNKISSTLFHFAAIIIHDLFRTDHKDFNISKTSSYLDLAPLYGSNLEEQQAMRTFKDGKIKPDCFSEKRILGFPPGVGVLLIMFNRFHNNIVANLALINENGRFNRPAEGLTDDKATNAWTKYDNDLFQTARLINCGAYVNVILKDYVRTILSLNRTNSTWDLDPRATETKTLLKTPSPEAVGNSVSAEFNLVYRWHSALSEKDEKWTQAEYEKLFPGKDPTTLSLHELVQGLRGLEGSIDDDPLKRTFGGLTRQDDGTFPDADLIEIFTSGTEDLSGSFGANRVPVILRSIEILGINQARSWNLASLNEFRQFFGLTKHTTFEDINPDPVIAEKLRNLYDSPDFVELYPGLVAEKAKPAMSPGSGLCLPYTMSRAILSDAVALVRGDRFFTVDYTPKNLTNWGFMECNYDLNVDQGHVLYKLLLTAFPTAFKPNSVYCHFPFVIPEENKVILQKLGTANKYDWTRPVVTPDLLVVNSYNAVVSILEDQKNFKVTWGEAIEYLVHKTGKNYGADYCLAGDNLPNTESRKLVIKALYPKNWRSEVQRFYEDTTKHLLKKYSYKIGTANQVDIVRDVANLAHTHFSASVFSLPLKTEANPHGIYTEQELYQVLSITFFAIFYDVDPSKSFLLRNAAKTLSEQLGELCLFNVEAIAKTGIIAEVINALHTKSPLSEYGTHMIQRLLDGGKSIKDVVYTDLVPTAASMVANQSQLFSQTLDYYLGDGSKYLQELNRIAKLNTQEADELLLRYFMEGSRMRSTVGLFRLATTSTTIKDGSNELNIPAGSKILLNMVAAAMDPAIFPDPHEVRLDRPINSYIHYGWGPHLCAGIAASKVAMVTMFKAVVKLDGLRRAPGLQGEVKKIPGKYGYTTYMTPDWSSMFPVPTTMKIMWDGELPK